MFACSLEYVLTHVGYEVTSVETVRSAVRLLEAQTFDLMLTDFNLPDGTGVQIADNAKARGAAVLIITGHPDNMGLSQYASLPKPIRPAELIEAIRKMLPNLESGAAIFTFPKAP